MPMGRSRRISWIKSKARGCRRLSERSRFSYMSGWGPVGMRGVEMLPECREECFGHQNVQRLAAKARASGPERLVAGLAIEQRLWPGGGWQAAEFKRATAKGLVGEQQFTQRAAAQAGQVKTAGQQDLAAGYAARVNPGLLPSA